MGSLTPKKKLAKGQAFINPGVIYQLPYGSINCIRFKGLERFRLSPLFYGTPPAICTTNIVD